MLRRLIFLVFMSICTLPLFSQEDANCFSLEQIIELATDNSRQIKNSSFETKKNAKEREIQLAKLLPQIEGYSTLSYSYLVPRTIIPGEIFGQEGNIAANLGTKYNWNTGIKASQLIYNSSYFTSLRIFREIVESSKIEEKLVKEEIVYNITNLYYLTCSIKRQIASIDSTLNNLKKIEAITSSMHKNGIAREVDVDRVTAEIESANIEKEGAISIYKSQLNMIKYLAGIDINCNISIRENPPLEESIVENPNSGDYTFRNEMMLLERQFNMATLERRMEKGSMLPTVSFFAEHSLQGMRDKFDFFKGSERTFYNTGMVGLNISIPIFGGFEKQKKIKKSEYAVSQMLLTKSDKEEEFKREMVDARVALGSGSAKLERSQRLCAISKSICEKSEKGYQEQVVSLTDLIIARNNHTLNIIKYYNALYEVRSAELRLKRATGEIIKK